MRIWIAATLLGAGTAVGLSLAALPPVRAKFDTFNALENKVEARPNGRRPEKRGGEQDDHGPDLVRMSAEQIAAQDIAVAKVEGGTIVRRLTVPGSILPAASRIARVPARVVGTVAEMRKQLGDRVEKNEIVAVLDSREVADAKGEYLTAQVNADLQQTNFERAQTLWDKRISAESAFLQARATNSETQLRLNLARQKLSALGLDARSVATAATREQSGGSPSSLRQYELRSPIAGRITDRRVDVGTAVGKEGDPADVYTVADLAVVWIDLAVPTSDLSRVKEGAPVLVTASNEESVRGDGRVIFVSPVLNLETRSARVIAELANPDGYWRPGTFVSGDIVTARDGVAAMITRSAIQTIEGEQVVFVRTDDGFRRQDIKTGRSDDSVVEVTAGLKAGDSIATRNTFLLKAELGKAGAAHDD